MQTATFKSLGLEVKIQVPSTADEFDALAKKTGACVMEAVRNVVYRGTLAEVRSVLLHGREADVEKNISEIKGMDKLFNMERETKPALDKEGKEKKDSDGNPVTVYKQTEEEFFIKICSTHNISEADQQKLMDNVTSQITFDPSATERKPSLPPKLSNKILEAAKALLNGGKLDELNKRFHKVIGKTFTATGDEAKDVQALGMLVKEYAAENEKQLLSKLVS